MKEITIQKLSARYTVGKLNLSDVELIYAFCQKNTQYYAYCGKEISVALIEHDLQITPPGIPLEQKYYIGFWENSKLVAIMDLILGYPDNTDAYIGFFMMEHTLQGMGIGSNIISETLAYLHKQGFQKCQLGIDKDNPQSNHFWRKNGFTITKEVELEEGIICVAAKQL